MKTKIRLTANAQQYLARFSDSDAQSIEEELSKIYSNKRQYTRLDVARVAYEFGYDFGTYLYLCG